MDGLGSLDVLLLIGCSGESKDNSTVHYSVYSLFALTCQGSSCGQAMHVYTNPVQSAIGHIEALVGNWRQT